MPSNNFDPLEIIFDLMSLTIIGRKLNWELLKESRSRYRRSMGEKYEDRKLQAKELIKKLDWISLFKIFNDEFQKLWDNFIITKNFEELSKYKPLFKLLIINVFEPHIISDLVYILTRNRQNDTVSNLEINKEAKDKLSKTLNNLFLTFHYFLAFTNLNENNIHDFIKLDIKEIKRLYEVGKKSSYGKRFRPEEIQPYEIAIQKYYEAIKQGKKKSKKEIALYIARTELGYEHDIEGERFYRRMNDYWRKRKK